jgi:hypothetical protein
MFCSNCGTKNIETDKFCRNCGKGTGMDATSEPQRNPESPPQVALASCEQGGLRTVSKTRKVTLVLLAIVAAVSIGFVAWLVVPGFLGEVPASKEQAGEDLESVINFNLSPDDCDEISAIVWGIDAKVEEVANGNFSSEVEVAVYFYRVSELINDISERNRGNQEEFEWLEEMGVSALMLAVDINSGEAKSGPLDDLLFGVRLLPLYCQL